MNKVKFFDAVLQLLKVVFSFLILASFLFLTYQLINVKLEDVANAGNDGYHSGTGLYIFASHVAYLYIDVIFFILGVICWLISKIYKSSPNQNKNISSFRFLTFAPLISHLLYLVLNIVVINLF